eukprot:491605_1
MTVQLDWTCSWQCTERNANHRLLFVSDISGSFTINNTINSRTMISMNTVKRSVLAIAQHVIHCRSLSMIPPTCHNPPPVRLMATSKDKQDNPPSIMASIANECDDDEDDTLSPLNLVVQYHDLKPTPNSKEMSNSEHYPLHHPCHFAPSKHDIKHTVAR